MEQASLLIARAEVYLKNIGLKKKIERTPYHRED
jgi:hypothetical protein